MKCMLLFTVVLAAEVSPIEKTVELLTNLQAKVVKDGENAQKVYEEFKEYCDDQSKELQFAVKTSKADVERAEATIAKQTAVSEKASARLADLAGTIATNEADLKAATEIRDKEAADFKEADQDLAETISMLRRAHAIIEREMNGGSFIQGSMGKVTDALQALLGAVTSESLNKRKVEAMLQSAQQTEDADWAPAGAPDAAAYESHSGSILSTLEDMLEKAEAQAADAQKAEMVAKRNFDMLAQKLQDAIDHEGQERKRAKSAKNNAEMAKAAGESDLSLAVKARDEGAKMLSDLQNDCMTKAQEFDTEQKSRDGELEALATAKSILEEKTGGAADRSYSFLQLHAGITTRAGLKAKTAKSVVALVQKLAKAQQAPELAQLAQRIHDTVREADLAGADPFAKVKGLIQSMIEKLIADAAAEASHKAFCDKEMSKTKAAKDDKEDEVDKLSTKIDKAEAKIAQLKEEVAQLTTELAEIAEMQKQADKVRGDEKAAYAAAKADYEAGLEGVGLALQVLRDYYAEKPADDESAAMLLQSRKHTKATGAASGIIGMLEVIESDFSRNLAEASAGEDQAQREYDQLTQDNKVATATKTAEVVYKEKDGKQTAALLAGYNSDRNTAQTELDAILEYWEKLQPMCVAKPEPYAERKKRREAEIAGLKQALQILENESAVSFLQVRS